jgi:hypothetical protein
MIEEIVGTLLVVGSAVLTQRRLARLFETRLREQDAVEEERRIALYKQQKATATAVAQSDRAVRKMIDQSRKQFEDTRLLQRQVDAHFADPAVKRLVNREANRG